MLRMPMLPCRADHYGSNLSPFLALFLCSSYLMTHKNIFISHVCANQQWLDLKKKKKIKLQIKKWLIIWLIQKKKNLKSSVQRSMIETHNRSGLFSSPLAHDLNSMVAIIQNFNLFKQVSTNDSLVGTRYHKQHYYCQII